MTQYVYRTLIVPAAFQALAQTLCETAAEGDAGKGMYTTALSANGQEPASHYISSGYIEDVFAGILPLTSVTPAEAEGEPDVVTTAPGQPEVVVQIAEQAGMPVPLETIQALFAAVDVSEQEPFVAMARLGVKMVQAELPL